MRKNTKGIIVLSLFDGIACGWLALKRAGIKVDKYYASEIDKYAISITQKNFPDIIQLGDVCKVRGKDLPKIDLLIGGSPCLGFSVAGKRLNFKDPQSKLFFEYVRLLKECKPRWFMLENVKMKKEWQDIISKYMGVESILINASLLTAQHRQRLYWSNLEGIKQPKDRGIMLKDVVFEDSMITAVRGRPNKDGKNIQRVEPRTDGKSNALTTVQKDNLVLSVKELKYMSRKIKSGRTHWDFGHNSNVRKDKSQAIVANFFRGVPYNVLKDWNCIRKLHPVECERLQTIPDRFTEKGIDEKGEEVKISNTRRYKCIGNAWAVDVIVHIFKYLKKEIANAKNN